MRRERTENSWNRLRTEAALRMKEHDALPAELRAVSNEHGLSVARRLAAKRGRGFLNELFG